MVSYEGESRRRILRNSGGGEVEESLGGGWGLLVCWGSVITVSLSGELENIRWSGGEEWELEPGLLIYIWE